MKTTVIVFSPSGHTRLVGERIKDTLKSLNEEVMLIDITGNEELLSHGAASISETVLSSDLLIVGAPVYAGHFESNMLRFIASLPQASNQRAAVFATYGGAHSSIALSDAAYALHSTGRTVVAGLKIAAEHTLTRTFDHPLCAGKPEADDLMYAEEFAKAIVTSNCSVDISEMLNYVSPQEQQMFRQKSQDDWHTPHRTVKVDSSRCQQCGACISICPVCRIYSKEDGSIAHNSSVTCILCGECYFSCPNNAVDFKYAAVVEPRLKSTVAEQPANKIFI